MAKQMTEPVRVVELTVAFYDEDPLCCSPRCGWLKKEHSNWARCNLFGHQLLFRLKGDEPQRCLRCVEAVDHQIERRKKSRL